MVLSNNLNKNNLMFRAILAILLIVLKIDILGVCSKIDDVTQITTRTTNKQVKMSKNAIIHILNKQQFIVK